MLSQSFDFDVDDELMFSRIIRLGSVFQPWKQARQLNQPRGKTSKFENQGRRTKKLNIYRIP